jgi:hypothetical protein
VHSSSNFATSRIDWGSVPDWIGGVGSALAFAGFAIAFIWEVRKRRQDDEQAAVEHRDDLKRHARLVFMKIMPGSETQKRLTIHNEGPGPILDVATTVWVWSDGTTSELREVQVARRGPNITELGAGQHGDVWLWFVDGEQISVGQEFFPQVEFTDCDGNRWRRRDNQQPVRLFDDSH